MYQWHAKVHRTGTKVAIFNGSKLVKVIEASKETFEPAEAQKFAEGLIDELQSRTSAQMSSPSAAPSTTTETELQNASMGVAKNQATGKGAGEGGSAAAPASVEVLEENEEKLANENEELRSVIAGLKRKLAQERNERAVERKARRGLAIAKQLVTDGKLEDSYDAIKQKIAEIVKLEESEIDRLERKIAGEHEFESVDDAQKELRRQARIARINRQAAAEAQEDGDEEQADSLDKRADEAEAKMEHIQKVIEEMNKVAEESDEAAENEEKAGPASGEDTEEKSGDGGATEEEKSAAGENGEEEKTDEAEEEKAETAEDETEEKASNDSTEKLAALARKYRSIAAKHRKLAETAEAKGDIETADKQDAMGDEAEEKAEDIEKKLAESAGSKPEEEKADKTDEEEKADKTDEEEKADEANENEEDEKKEGAKKDPGKTVTSSEHKPLKREDGEAVEEFGIDKNASLVEENDYSNDPEVEILSKMWTGAPKELD